MAMTRIINVTGGNYRHELWVEVVSQNIGANQSTLEYEYRIVRTVSASSGAYSGTAKDFRATINGVNDIETKVYDFRDYVTLIASSGSRTITHTSDGTKTISTSIYGPDPTHSSFFPTTSGSANYTLPAIPRASTPTFEVSAVPVTTVDAGTLLTIQTNRADSAFTHDITYTFGALVNQSIATAVGASTTWTPPLSMLNQIPNATSGTVQIKTVTKNGGSTIGETTVNLTLTAGSGIVPDFTTVTHSEETASPNVAAIVGAYVKGLTTLDLDITGAVGAYGSTITAYKIEVAGQTINAASGISTALTTSGTYNVRGTVTDSRGRSYYEDVPITVLDYAVPTISAYAVERTDVGGTASPTGTYLKVSLTAVVTSLVVSTQKNTLTWRVKVRPRGDATAWSSISPVHSETAGSTGTTDSVILGTYATGDSYDVRVEVEDALGSVSSLLGVLPTGGVLMHMSATEDGIGVGKFHEQGSIDTLGQIYQNAGLAVIDTGDAATTTVSGIIELATQTEVSTGTDATRAVTPATLSGLLALLHTGADNRIINGDFRVNQRVAASGTSLALDAYFLDRWKSATSTNAVTWTGDDVAGRTLTIPATEAIYQFIERANMPAGDYTLAWEGTATGAVYREGDSVPTLAASPITVALDGTTNVVVRFGPGTLSKVRLLPGSKAYPFVPRQYAAELALCHRYYYRVAPGADDEIFGIGTYLAATNCAVVIPFPTVMRVDPTLEASAASTFEVATSTRRVTSSVTLANGANRFLGSVIAVTASATLDTPGILRSTGTTSYLGFIAEM